MAKTPKTLKDFDFVPLAELKGWAESHLKIYDTKVSGSDLSKQYVKMTGELGSRLELVISGRVMLGTHVVNKVTETELATMVYVQEIHNHKTLSKKIPVEINLADYRNNILAAVLELKKEISSGVIKPTFNAKSEKKLEEIHSIPVFSFNPFLIDLDKAVKQYGSLTPKQEQALQNVKQRFTPKVQLNQAQKDLLIKLEMLPSSLSAKENATICSVYAKACSGEPWTPEDRKEVLALLKKHP